MMNLFKKPSKNVNPQNLFVQESRPVAASRLATGIFRLALPAVLAGAILGTLIASSALAESGKQAGSTATPAIDPEAMNALNKMGVYLRTLKSFQVTSDMTTDDVLESGQTIQFTSKVDMVTARPNRLRVEVTDDDGHRFFFFDGKNFTIFGQFANYYATVPAASTLGELTDNLINKYGIELPLTDLFLWGTKESSIDKIKSAVDIGPSAVEGVTCEQYAFRQPGLDWQIWIELGEFPLPRKLVIRTLTDDAKPQHMEVLSWNLAPSFNDNAFTFDPPQGVLRITLAEVQAKAAKVKK